MQEDSFHKARILLAKYCLLFRRVSSVYKTQPLSDALAPRWRVYGDRVINTLYNIYVDYINDIIFLFSNDQKAYLINCNNVSEFIRCYNLLNLFKKAFWSLLKRKLLHLNEA
jgi:hypothetical protein